VGARGRHSVLYTLYLGSPLCRARRWWWFVTGSRCCARCGRTSGPAWRRRGDGDGDGASSDVRPARAWAAQRRAAVVLGLPSRRWLVTASMGRARRAARRTARAAGAVCGPRWRG